MNGSLVRDSLSRRRSRLGVAASVAIDETCDFVSPVDALGLHQGLFIRG